MAKLANFLQGAAGAAGGGEALNVEDVFSTYLYTGNDTSQTITNGLDLDGEGGLVWIKQRDGSTQRHILYDTERGTSKTLSSDRADAEFTSTTRVTSFNSDGFDLGSSSQVNGDPSNYASWTFRKAPKFFDVVTYTGDGVNGKNISHSLGSTVGTVILKRTDAAKNWFVWHRSAGITTNAEALYLNTTGSKQNTGNNAWGSSGGSPSMTSTTFSVGDDLNVNGGTYVAYLFAHNDGDGEFGGEADADIIKCGSYTGGGDVAVDVGFEPQWVLTKATGLSQNWTIHDTMRGYTADATGQATLHPNVTDAEDTGIDAALTSTGFRTINSSTGQNYIYIAIRRGTKVPESGTEVFDMDLLGSTSPSPPNYNSNGWPVDMGLQASRVSGSNVITSRLTQGKYLVTDATSGEATSAIWQFDFQNGWRNSSAVSTDYLSYMWKRAPNFFDAVAYSGNSTAGRTVSHNLGVAPEMMWVKSRNNSSYNWRVYHKDLGNNAGMALNLTNAVVNNYPPFWNSTSPSSTDFTLGNSAEVNRGGYDYISYLFASLDGISKVGSYTGDGTTDGSKVIDCGFTSGARFVLTKDVDNTGNWNLFDTTSGITVGNDNFIRLNSTSAQVSTDWVDPDNSGFIVRASVVNTSGTSYIFYAIA